MNFVDDIWHNDIPSKVSLFVWRLLRNILPTKDNLVRRRVLHQDDAACVSDCGNSETATHLFLGYVLYTALFGLMCSIGWVSLQFFLVNFDNTMSKLLKWQVCLDSLTHSSQSFGLHLFGLFGRRVITEYSKTWSLILQLSSKRLN